MDNVLSVNGKTKKKMNKRQLHKTISCYGILSTQLIGFLVFSLYPILWAAQKAFYYYTGTPSQTRFVGLSNFITIFTTETAYWRSWLNTLIFGSGKLLLELPFAMLVALCLRKKLKGAGFFRAMFYMPCVISVAIVGLMFSNMFDYFGFINAWIVKLGIAKQGIEWFSNTGTAMAALVLGSIWYGFGVNVMYFLAAMSNVPKEVYESAELDGASKWITFWKITLPLMAPVLQTILLLTMNAALHVNEYVIVTTNGAPHGSTYTVMAYITGKFVPGFADSTVINIGYGCAIAMITSICMMIFALVYSKLSKKMQNIY